jgi:hypothetical protein
MIWRRVVVVIAAWLLLTVVQVWAAGEPRRVAMVIGNSHYEFASVLPNTRADARLVADSLKAAGFTIVGGGAQIDLSADKMRDAFSDFGSMLSENTVAVLYYAGHGIEYDGENYLIPVDSNPTPGSVWDLIKIGDLMRAIDRKHTGLAIVILDACRTNPFPKGTRDTTGGLAQIQAPRGTVIAFSTQPGAAAADGTGVDSPYAEALARTIRQSPGLDIFHTFNEVAQHVDAATGHLQMPWVSLSALSGDFFFMPPGGGRSADTPRTPAPSELRDPSKIISPSPAVPVPSALSVAPPTPVQANKASLFIYSSANASSSKDLARLLTQSLDNIGFPIAPDLATDTGPSVEITAIAIDGPHQPNYPRWTSTVAAHVVMKRGNATILSRDFPATSKVSSSEEATPAALLQVANLIAQYLYDNRQSLKLSLR